MYGMGYNFSIYSLSSIKVKLCLVLWEGWGIKSFTKVNTLPQSQQVSTSLLFYPIFFYGLIRHFYSYTMPLLSHFTDGNTEAQRNPTSDKWPNQELNAELHVCQLQMHPGHHFTPGPYHHPVSPAKICQLCCRPKVCQLDLLLHLDINIDLKTFSLSSVWSEAANPMSILSMLNLSLDTLVSGVYTTELPAKL